MQRLLPFWIVLMGMAGPVLAQGPHPILTEFVLIRQYEGISVSDQMNFYVNNAGGQDQVLIVPAETDNHLHAHLFAHVGANYEVKASRNVLD